MASIVLDRVSFDYPVVPLEAQSLKLSFLNLLSGNIGRIQWIRAIDDISLSITSGERVGLRGANGAGKTSLLRLLASIYQPTAGKVTVSGWTNPLLSLGAGANLELSAESNIRLLLRIDGLKPDDALVEEVWQFTEIGDNFRHMPLRVFSAGMLMRVLFSVATAQPAPIIIMDEWLSVGDQTFVEKASARLKACVDQAKILVLASHSDVLLNSLCTRIITLEHGKVVKDETA